MILVGRGLSLAHGANENEKLLAQQENLLVPLLDGTISEPCISLCSPVTHLFQLDDTYLPTIFNHTVRKKQDKESRNEEPEWFTFGPSSQFETMELKGFDEDEVIKRGVDIWSNITHSLTHSLFAPVSGA